MSHNLPSCNETCLQIEKPFERWGNNFKQLLYAVDLAKYSGLKKIVIPNNFFFIDQNFLWDNISIELNNGNNTQDCIPHIYFYEFPGYTSRSYVIPENVKTFYSRYFDIHPLSNDTLVIHIRSGDIFKKAHKRYAQPFCQYYFDIMDHKNWSQILLLAEDNLNPCVNKVIEHGAKWVSGTLIHDLSIMMSAKNFAYGRGTFGEAVVSLSQYLQTVYTFNSSFGRRFQNNYNCIPDDDYFNKVIENWKLKPGQLKKMVTAKCKQWTSNFHQ